MRSAAIIVLLVLFSSGPSAAERLFSSPLRDAAVNHDLAKVKKTQANISTRAEADSMPASVNGDSLQIQPRTAVR
ncbi:hypothetical protein [Bradyrhizobium sp.]|jgi:hypothetical protein|uniref:hypothetical protein n=1 Tax=Bradyrhizobium sp. TaxID=376 RepID=UPI002DDCF260|nr:hypothetical protein [Bradyrhizobium sp.]HEV2154471.1 hypothetical protein [Bradyrhizobium sp.]